MADSILPGVEVKTYRYESLIPTEATGAAAVMDAMGVFLLDLVNKDGYRVVSGVRYELPEAESVDYPTGFTACWALVDVQEFDVEIDAPV